jgi:hypothetical protein
MTQEEIRTLRESLGLSQPEFIAELGLKCDRETARKRAPLGNRHTQTGPGRNHPPEKASAKSGAKKASTGLLKAVFTIRSHFHRS